MRIIFENLEFNEVFTLKEKTGELPRHLVEMYTNPVLRAIIKAMRWALFLEG